MKSVGVLYRDGACIVSERGLGAQAEESFEIRERQLGLPL